MLTSNFFLLEIIQFFLLLCGLGILASRKKYSDGSEGFQWDTGGRLAQFRAENGYFSKKKSTKFHGLLLFKNCLITKIL